MRFWLFYFILDCNLSDNSLDITRIEKSKTPIWIRSAMSQLERSIRLAFDKISGKVLDINEVCSNPKDSAEIRLQYSRKELALICCECDQELEVSKNKYDMAYFRHKSGRDDCILTENKLQQEYEEQEYEEIIEFLKHRESDRHKQLKNKIGSLLYKVDGVDKSSIAIDNKLVIRGSGKRRPDVYCKYKDKEIVFEIQLSKLPLSYILRRHDFYKAHGIYLMWILDNFDIGNQGRFEKDIKYLTNYQNYFKLDENITETLSLECKYKAVFITEENEQRDSWETKSVTLSQVNFDNEAYQIYYYNYGDNKAQAQIQQRKRAEEIKEAKEAERVKATAVQRRQSAEFQADSIIKEIKELRERKAQNFGYVSIRISDLDEEVLQVLNERLGFTRKSPVIHWFSTVDRDDIAFVEFIFGRKEIEFDVNATDKDGKTSFQAVYENKEIRRHDIPAKLLFERGYKLTEADRVFFSKLSPEEREIDITVYNFCDHLADKTFVEFVFQYKKQLWAIESAKRQEIIGFWYKPNEWVALANNAVDNYGECWEYIELAFKKFGLWDTLIKKESFANKVRAFYEKRPKQDSNFGKVVKDLYPELGDLENSG